MNIKSLVEEQIVKLTNTYNSYINTNYQDGINIIKNILKDKTNSKTLIKLNLETIKDFCNAKMLNYLKVYQLYIKNSYLKLPEDSIINLYNILNIIIENYNNYIKVCNDLNLKITSLKGLNERLTNYNLLIVDIDIINDILNEKGIDIDVKIELMISLAKTYKVKKI